MHQCTYSIVNDEVFIIYRPPDTPGHYLGSVRQRTVVFGKTCRMLGIRATRPIEKTSLPKPIAYGHQYIEGKSNQLLFLCFPILCHVPITRQLLSQGTLGYSVGRAAPRLETTEYPIPQLTSQIR